MGLDYRPQTTSAAQFAAIFATERAQRYPAVDALEAQLGHALDTARLEQAARVLSCPFKAAAPNWQHGRVIYAALRHYIDRMAPTAEDAGDLDAFMWVPRVTVVDIGTAKGYSALCAQWAIDDAGAAGQVYSIDVLPQGDRLRRNTVAEVDGLRTLAEVLGPWPAAKAITFRTMTGVDFLKSFPDRIHSAFVDGKHSTDAVSAEWRLLSARQRPGGWSPGWRPSREAARAFGSGAPAARPSG